MPTTIFVLKNASVCRAYLSVLLLLLVIGSEVSHAGYESHPETKKFIAQMVAKHKMDSKQLQQLFAGVEKQERALELIQRPAEKKFEWKDYRPIFITEERINAGVSFWKEHQKVLEKAQLRYGVPASMIVAIIGVETYYGRLTGGFPALDALTTLAFDYPRRSKFFRTELEQFLLLVEETSLKPAELEGSYAAAFGLPQFISSSYRNYAIDFDGDGQRDLWNSVPDAVGSVANYFYRHGWKGGQAVAQNVTDIVTASKGVEKLVVKGMPKPKHSLQTMQRVGIYPKRKGSGTYTLLKLQGDNGAEYWVGHHNFYVITRYNHSSLYAMAVHQLSEKIRSRFHRHIESDN